MPKERTAPGSDQRYHEDTFLVIVMPLGTAMLLALHFFGYISPRLHLFLGHQAFLVLFHLQGVQGAEEAVVVGGVAHSDADVVLAGKGLLVAAILDEDVVALD